MSVLQSLFWFEIGKSKLSDEKDVYDMDTIHGTFNGLQELQVRK